MVEASVAFPPSPWEVAIFVRNSSRDPWTETRLKPSSETLQLLSRSPTEVDVFKSRYYHVYVGQVSIDSETSQPLKFQVRYRLDSDSAWAWVEDYAGISFGEIIIQKPLLHNQPSISDYIDLESGWDISSHSSGKPTSPVFLLEFPVKGAPTAGDDFTIVTKILGSVTDQQRYFALAQVAEPWIAPKHGASAFDLQEDGMLACFLNSSGQCITVLGLSGLGAMQVAIKSTESCEISITARNNSADSDAARLVAAVANDVESSIEAAVNYARDIFAKSQNSSLFSETGLKQISSEVSDFTSVNEDLDDWYDGLLYCTWNSLGWDLNPEKISRGLQTLLDNGIQVSSLIIDDNWQTIDDSDTSIERMHQGMERFEANKSFPGGFAAGINRIRAEHPYVGDIAVWHALFGYWGGISPRGQLASDYKTSTIEAQYWRHVKKDMCTINAEDIHRFYDDFYTFLSSCGITSVKTDVQYMAGEFTSGLARAEFLENYASAWTAAHLTHFKGRAISCMSMIPQNLLRSFLRTDLPKVLLRNSDDFFPEIPVSHPLHLFVNAHNALLIRHLNVVADWDMFQTSHPYSAFHAAGRCLSGGPISITDTPGDHDLDLIHEMTALSPAGRTIALRPFVGGRTISAWDRFSARNLLKIGALCGVDQSSGTALLGLFNIDDQAHTALVNISDFPLWESDSQTNGANESILLRTHRDNRFFEPVNPRESSTLDKLLYATIDVRSFDIIYSHAVHTLSWNSRNISLALLGLLNKMTGPAAIVSWTIEVINAKMELRVELKALGSLGIWFSKESRVQECKSPEVRLNGIVPERADVTFDEVENGGTVLQINVLKIWEEVKPANVTGAKTVQLVVCWE